MKVIKKDSLLKSRNVSTEPSNGIFASLISPALTTQFLQKLPLGKVQIIRGDVNRFGFLSRIPELRNFDSILKCAKRGATINVIYADSKKSLLGTNEILARQHYAQCSVIYMTQMERAIPKIKRITETLRHELNVANLKVGCGVFLSSPGRGASMHFDLSSIFNIQLKGSKEWTVAEDKNLRRRLIKAKGSILEVYGEGIASKKNPLPKKKKKITARPGTLIFVPFGVWHKTRTSSASVALGFSIENAN